jgi:putative flavoprotein involved in K+ transport
MTLNDGHPMLATDGTVEPDGSYDVLVVGAGQAGLTVGYYLKQAGLRVLIVDAADRVGAAWVHRWESLILFTPRRYNAMPGLPFDGDPNQEPTRGEVIDYVQRYATELDLPVELNNCVIALDYREERYAAELSSQTITADQVIVATGPFQQPRIPPFAASLASDIYQTHSTGYRRPSDLPQGRVVVVGGGNTGYQIAEELITDHEVILAVGSRQTPLPRRLLGRQLFWWLTKLGLQRVSVDSRLGRRLSERETLIGSSPRKAKREGIILKPRALSAAGRTIRFADGTEAEADAVIWATGYQSDYSWINISVFDDRGRPRHRRGVTDQAGLYFLGLSWQYTRGSALLGFVSDDARHIAQQIASRTRSIPTERPR